VKNPIFRHNFFDDPFPEMFLRPVRFGADVLPDLQVLRLLKKAAKTLQRIAAN
jgi:hypothetical protein